MKNMNKLDLVIKCLEEKIIHPEIVVSNKKIEYKFLKKSYSFSTNSQSYLGELGRAYFIQTLLEKGIDKNNIFLEENTQIGSGNNSKRADLFLKTKEIEGNKECYILTELKTTINNFNDTKLNNFFKKQLYNIASSIRAMKDFDKYPCFLMLVTLKIEKDCKIKQSYFLADFNTVKYSKIDVKNYKKIFKIENGNIFINTFPLKYKNLQEFKTSEDFRNLLDVLHNTLRIKGIINEEAFSVIFHLLLAKLYEEINILNKGQEDKILDFQVLSEDYLKLDNLYKRINSLYQNARFYFFKEDIKFIKTNYNIDLDKNLLKDLVLKMQYFKFKSTKKLKDDVLGDVFEEFIHQLYKQSKGMFFTHPNITSFCAKALGFNKKEIQKDIKENNKYICDPSCGSGSFLIESLRELYKEDSYYLIKEQAEKNFYGIDVSKEAVEITKVNMALNGDGSAKIYCEDALLPLNKLVNIFTFLRNNKKGQIDYILSNPPFSLEELDINNLTYFKMSKLIPNSNQSEYFFIERWWELLIEEGIIAVVLPLSVIENKSNKEALKLINCFFEFYAIIYLPEFAFAPFANQKCMLLFAKKRKYEEYEKLKKIMAEDENNFLEKINKKVFFKEVKNIGYKREKKKTIRTIHSEENELNDKLAEKIFQKLTTNKNFQEDIELKDLLNLATGSNNNKNSIFNDFDISNVFLYENIEENINNNLLLVETGDIHKKSGLIIPKTINDVSDSKLMNLKKKIKNKKFIKLLPCDVILAPVRVYQKKFSIVTVNASKNFLFAKDFIVMRNKKIIYLSNDYILTNYSFKKDYIILRYFNKELKNEKIIEYKMNEFYEKFIDESLKVLNSLLDKQNEQLLFLSSKTGKSGYPKLNKELLKKHNKIVYTSSNIIDIELLYSYNFIYEKFKNLF